MKKLSKINLSDLGQAEMQKKEMSMIRGGMMETEEPVIPTTSNCLCNDEKCGCFSEGTKEGSNDDFWISPNAFDNLNANGAYCAEEDAANME